MNGICDDCNADKNLSKALSRIARLESVVKILSEENKKLILRISKKEQTISILREA